MLEFMKLGFAQIAFGGGGDGGGGGGGSDDGGSKSKNRSEADIQQDINNALKESGGEWTPELNDLVAEREVARSGGTSTSTSGGGGGGRDDDDSPAPQAMAATETNNPSNYFADRDNDGVPNIFDFDDGVGWADVSAQDTDTGGGDDEGPRTDYSGLSFNDAFSQARSNLGPGQTFTYEGNLYSTATAEEAPELAGPTQPAFDIGDVAASFEEEATAADREIASLQTPRTDLDLSGGISNLLPPLTTPRDDTFVDSISDISYELPPSGEDIRQGPTLDGTAGYTYDVTRDVVDPISGNIVATFPTTPSEELRDTYVEGYQQGLRDEDLETFVDQSFGISPVVPTTPVTAVDEFSGLPPSMTDQYYVPPSVSTSLIGTGDPVLDAITRATTTPTTTVTQPISPLTNPLGQQPTTQSDVVGQLVRGAIRTGQLGARGIESLAESIAPQSQATIGYGEGQIDPALARAAGYTGTAPIAVGDRNIISQAAGTVAEDLGRLSNRAFSNLSPAEREALTADIFGEEGFNLDALRAQTLSSLVPTVASISPLGLGLGMTPTMIAGGLLTAGETAEEALANVRSYAAANNLTPQETAALESQVLEYNAPAAFATGSLGQLVYGAPVGSIPTRAVAGAVEEALQEGYAEPQVAALATDIALGTDTFGRQFDPNAAIVGALLGGGANVALSGETTVPQTERTTAAQPAAPTTATPPATVVTPGAIQIPGTDVVVNTTPVTPMTQAPTMQTPAPLGTGGIFQPGFTQQGPIITPPPPAQPPTPALPSPTTAAETINAVNEIQAEVVQTGELSAERAQEIANRYNLSMQEVANLAEQEMGISPSIAQQPVPASTLPAVTPQTGIATLSQPPTETVLEGEILPPLSEVSTEVTPPREGEIIDQTITRDVAVQTQPPVPPETVTTPETAVTTTPTGVFVNVADEPPVEDEVTAAVLEPTEEDVDTGVGGGEEEDITEVTIADEGDGGEDEEEEEEEVLEEEEPPFECPPGFRRVQMANGGFTCVPAMVRPRVGPFTGTVDVSALQGRTVFRPGTRRR